ncbi:MAG: MFS transporter [Candidatus Falkowbacteria bacterium]
MTKKKILSLYYGLEFLINLGTSFFFATYAIFLLSKGLNLWQINLINACFMLAGALFEIPTGSVADNYGRKLSFVLSCFITGASMLVYYFSSTFTWFVVAEIIAALGVTFASGAFDAWAVDSLDFSGEAFCLNKIMGGKAKSANIGRVIGSVAGAYAGAVDIALPWLVAGTVLILSGVLAAFLMDEPYFRDRKKTGTERTGMKKIIADSCRFGIKNRSVFFLCLTAMSFCFACMPLNMFWQPFFRDGLGVPVVALGWIYGGIVLMAYLGNELFGRLGHKFKKEKYALLLSLAVFAIAAIFAALSPVLFLALAGFYAHELARGFYSPAQGVYLNRRIPGRMRATIQSFVSALDGLGAFAGLLASGWIAQKYGVNAAWISAGSFLICATLALSLMKNGE